MEKKFNIRKLSLLLKNLNEIPERYINRYFDLIQCKKETESVHMIIALICKLIPDINSHSSASEKKVFLIISKCITHRKFLNVNSNRIYLLLNHFQAILAGGLMKVMECHNVLIENLNLTTEVRREFRKCRGHNTKSCKSFKACRAIIRTCLELFINSPALLKVSPGENIRSHESFTENSMKNLKSPDQYRKCRKQVTINRVVFRVFPVFYRINHVEHGD